MNILYVTSELTPLVGTGGLGEIAQSLPRALAAEGHDVRIAMPCYHKIPMEKRGTPYCMAVAHMGSKTEYGSLRTTVSPEGDIPLYLIEHNGYFDRPDLYGDGNYEYGDNAERFCFFCLAVLNAIPQTGWMPDVVHCHDWHTAPIPSYLRTRFHHDPVWGGKPVVFTIHNLAFQGRYGPEKFQNTGFEPWLMHPDYFEYYGDMNLMKACLRFATKLSTVSPRYAQEIQTPEYGEGLDGILRSRSTDLRGILNGIDYSVWSPQTDRHIPAAFDPGNWKGKTECKRAVQHEFGLPMRDVPVVGMVTRLYWQKGIDLVTDAVWQLGDLDFQLVILGTGDSHLQESVWELKKQFGSKVAVRLEYNAGLSHRVIAGSDFFLMPSRYEPCGLGQMYAMAYGTVPIVRRTGGLADSVVDYNPVTARRQQATGISFVPSTSLAVADSLRRAAALYDQPITFRQLRNTAMEQDFSWERSCDQYIQLYREAIGYP